MGDHSTKRLPSRSEAINLIRSAHQAAATSKNAILISGPAGIGKTTVVTNALQELSISLRGFGKGEQFGSAHPYRPIVDALSDALRRWLPGAPPSEVQFLRNSIEGYQDLLVTLLPALHSAWGPPDASQALTLEQRNRTPFALRMLVQAMSKLSTPLVLVFDDFHWLDEETLKRLEWGFSDPELRAVLCIFCCRDDSWALKRARLFMKTLAIQGAQVQEVVVGPLSEDEIALTVSERLKRPQSELKSQISLLSQSSAGSPLYLQHALDLILSGGTLATETQSSGDVLQLLTRQLESFSSSEREVLGLAACAGRQLQLPVLLSAAAMVAPDVDMDNLLHKAVQNGFLSLEDSHPVLVQMTHDRVQEACAGSSTSWPARHLALFEAGLKTLAAPTELDDQQLFWMLDREFTASALLLEHPQRLPALHLALAASKRARYQAASQTAARAAALAHRLLLDCDDNPTRVAVLLEHAVVSWLNGDSYRFQALSEEVESLATPLELVPITELQLRDAIARGEMSKTVDLAIEAAKRLFPNLPQKSLKDGLGHWDQTSEARGLLDRLDHLQPSQDPTTVAVTSLLTTANAAAYVGDPERLACLIAMQLDLALEVGDTPSFPLTLAYWGAILTTSGSTLGLAIDIGERALSRSRLGSDGLVQARTADLVYGMVLCWKDDLRQVIHPLLQNRDLALRHGTFEYAGYSLLKSLTYRLYTGSTLTGLARDIRAGRAQMLSLRQVRIARYLERDEAVLRLLQTPGPNPSALTDNLFDGAALQDELRASGDRYGLLYTAVARLLLALVHEQESQCVELALEAEKLRDGGPGLAHQAMLSWLSALAVLSGSQTRTPDQIELAQSCLTHLEIVSRHASQPWSARAAFVKAELIRHQGPKADLEAAVEEALQQAVRSGLVLDEILIYQRRGLIEGCDRRHWQQKADLAVERWQSRPQTSAAELRPDQLLECAAKLASSPNFEMLGAALVEMLWNTVGGDVGIVVGPGSQYDEETRGYHPGQQLIGSWNATLGYGAELVNSVIRSGQTYSDGNTICVPILCGGLASGAILIHYAQAGSEQHSHLDHLPCLRSLAQLAGVALTNIGQKLELGRVENEFTDREALYSTLIHESTAAIFVRDLEGRLLLANQAYAKALGDVPLHSLLGRVVFDLLPPAQAEQHRLLDQSVLESGCELEALEQLGSNPRQLKTFLCLRIPSRDRWGVVTGICGICTDITELERTREQLDREKHLSALGTFAGKIAHDFNNVLNGIVCNVEFLLGDLDIDSPWREGLSDIEFAAEQGVQLVRQILAFGGKQEPQRENLSLPELLDGCVSLLKATLPSGTTLERWVSPDLHSRISGDPTQLRQVISNLLVNAAQALPSGKGLIQMKIAPYHQAPTRPLTSIPPGDYVCLSIRDSGTGMSEETMSKVFEPFFSTKPSGQGTGLGLAIVHGIVKSHGGHILLESQLGKGTKFSLFFPAVPE